jgi:hypothetical protein
MIWNSSAPTRALDFSWKSGFDKYAGFKEHSLPAVWLRSRLAGGAERQYIGFPCPAFGFRIRHHDWPVAVQLGLAVDVPHAPAEPKSLTVGANDVGLDERGVARGPAMLTKSSVGVDANGKRTARSFFESPLLAQPPAERPDAPPVARTLRKGSGLAIVASVDLIDRSKLSEAAGLDLRN